jgi:predicted dehydrogenase
MSGMKGPVRFAYVGCGFVGQTIHIPNFASLPNCQFVALAEPRPDLGKRVSERYGIRKLYRSHEEIAGDPEIEAVGVSAPYTLQGPIAHDLLRAGKHVFMEKPMAVSVKRAEAIVEAVRNSSARLMVGYMKRYDTGNVLLKKHADEWRASGEQVVLARNHGFGGNWIYAADPNIPFETSQTPPPPAPADEYPEWLPEKWRKPYLEYLQQWTHNANLLRFFLGDDGGKTFVKSVQLDVDGLTGVVVLEINGVRAVIESAYTSFHGWDENTQLYFRRGWLRTSAPALTQKETPATVEIYRAASEGQPAQSTQEFAGPGWAFREEARHFLDCVRSGAPFRSSAEDTLHDVRLFEEIYRQFIGTTA